MSLDVLLIAGGGLIIVLLVLVVAQRRTGGAARAELDHFRAIAAEIRTAHGELAGRLTQLAEESRIGQSSLTKTLEERLDAVSKRMGESLEQSSSKAAKTMGDLQVRLAVIDQAQKNITELSGHVVGLQEILANKQERGAFGEIRLMDLVRNALPPSAFEFQVTLSNNRRADCLLRLPNPPGPIVVDAKFPLESYRAMQSSADDTERKTTARQFERDVLKHVRDIAERYIIPGETADSALMFLPSEAIYAELHVNFPNLIEKSFREKVWIVSPTTLMATLHTIRAVLQDVQMREHAHVIQKEVVALFDDIERLAKRVENLSRHFSQAGEDVRQISISTDKIAVRVGRIEEIQIGDDAHAVGTTDVVAGPAISDRLAAK